MNTNFDLARWPSTADELDPRRCDPSSGSAKKSWRNAARGATVTPSRFIGHTGIPVQSWSYCVLSPFCCHRRLWTAVTGCFSHRPGDVKIAIRNVSFGSLFFNLSSMRWHNCFVFIFPTGWNAYETGFIVEALSLCLLEKSPVVAHTQILIPRGKSPQAAGLSACYSHAFCMFCDRGENVEQLVFHTQSRFCEQLDNISFLFFFLKQMLHGGTICLVWNQKSVSPFYVLPSLLGTEESFVLLTLDKHNGIKTGQAMVYGQPVIKRKNHHKKTIKSRITLQKQSFPNTVTDYFCLAE